MNKEFFISKVSKIEQTFEDEFRGEFNSPELIWNNFLKNDFFWFDIRDKPAMQWIAFYEKIETSPIKYARYLFCRKDCKIHFETWNSTEWDNNHNDIRFYAPIISPIN